MVINRDVSSNGMVFTPIPLTEEWLLKLGFDNSIEEELPEDADLLVFFKDNYSVEIIPDDMGIKNTFMFCIYEDIVDSNGELSSQGVYEKEIEYVHQIQNFYFALTGEELTIKP